MIEATFGALLVTTVRSSALGATTNAPTPFAAILLAPVAAAADIENRAAEVIPANSLTENQFRCRCHLLVRNTGQRPRIVGAWACSVVWCSPFPGSLQQPRPPLTVGVLPSYPSEKISDSRRELPLGRGMMLVLYLRRLFVFKNYAIR